MAIQRYSPEDRWAAKEWNELEESRRHITRQLSGEFSKVPCYCDICKRNHSKSIPIEHANNQFAFKLNGRLVINCDYCNNTKKYRGR